MQVIQSCQVDPAYFEPISECAETYGMYDCNPGNEWPWNVISTKAIAFSCGAICRIGDDIEHNHSAAELAMCKQLAQEVAQVACDVAYCGYSASDLPPSPFYRVANIGTEVPQQFDESIIRNLFGGTIYPAAPIWLEPLEEHGEWWSEILLGGFWYEDNEEEFENYLKPWRRMIDWFYCQPELHNAVFVRIGKEELDLLNGGCVFPRLALAMTKAGSVVGIWNRVSHA